MKIIATKNDGTDYQELIESIQAIRVPLYYQAMSFSILKLNLLTLRHDIDHDIVHALEFAKAEADLGYYSTYFLLPTAAYFDYGVKLAKWIREFDKLGHEIGIHNNALTLYWTNLESDYLEQGIIKPLRFIRDLSVPVFGTSAHGDGLCSKYGFVNYEVWQQCPDKIRKSQYEKRHAVDMTASPYNLKYEAYFLHRDAYLTDSGHQWSGSVKHIPPFEKAESPLSVEETVMRFNSLPRPAVMQLLTHPCWWEIQ